MEIRIRTHEELRTDRVTIEITGTGAEVREVAKLPSRNLYTDEEVATLQASEAELVAGPLQARINELEDKLVEAVNRNHALQRQVHGYDSDRHTERDRADRITREHGQCAGILELREKDAETFQRQRNELEARVKDLESKLMKGHVCTAGCTGDQHVAFVGRQALSDLENQVAELTRRIDHMTEVLSADDVQQAQRMDCSRIGQVMAKAIDKALHGFA